MTEPFTVGPVTAAEIVDLRWRVLRVGQLRATAVFDGDDLPTSRHFAAEADGRVIGCATFFLNTFDGESAWQLRGMATDSDWHGRGVGRAVLDASGAAVAAAGPRLLWCNAREAAVGFYRRVGWTVASDRFDVPGYGPHFRMWRRP